MSNIRFTFCILFFSLFATINPFAQNSEKIIISDTVIDYSEDIDPIAPSKAAFYSAILPGLGQAYNKKYWKVPIIYAAMGTSIYFAIDNNNNYNRARDAYKLSRAGKPHEFDGTNGNVSLSDETLENLQSDFKQDRDLAIFITVGIYALQIIEASVNAHLMQLNTIDNLTLNPNFTIDPITRKARGGLSLSYSFK